MQCYIRVHSLYLLMPRSQPSCWCHEVVVLVKSKPSFMPLQPMCWRKPLRADFGHGPLVRSAGAHGGRRNCVIQFVQGYSLYNCLQMGVNHIFVATILLGVWQKKRKKNSGPLDYSQCCVLWCRLKYSWETNINPCIYYVDETAVPPCAPSQKSHGGVKRLCHARGRRFGVTSKNVNPTNVTTAITLPLGHRFGSNKN